MMEKNDPEEIQGYLEDPSNLKGQAPDKVVLPGSTQEVADVLRQAHGQNVPVTISGGGTGVVGGRIPQGGWVISTEKLNQVQHIDPDTRRASLQAGVIVDVFLEELKRAGLFYPPFPTEKTAFIGGTVATNASGEYTYRFGCTREYVERLTVVLANGEPVDIRRGEHILTDGTITVPGLPGSITTAFRSPDLPKNSCGYYLKPPSDLIDLFIGSEGTLGVITDIEVSLIPDLQDPLFCVIFLSEPAGFTFSEQIRQSPLEKSLFCLEYFDSHSLALLSAQTPIPPGSCEALLLILDMTEEDSVLEELEAVLETPSVADTWASDSAATREKIYAFRQGLPEAVNEKVKAKGIVKLSTDIAVPEAQSPAMFAFYQELLSASPIEYAMFGHIGESHLHVNLLPEPGQVMDAEKLYVQFLQKAVALGGTIGAEHGIGKKKAPYLPLMFSPEQLMEMRKIKDFLDPPGILSPGNIFD
jgi:D-lactate dehydrogenase (cytochrome)